MRLHNTAVSFAAFVVLTGWTFAQPARAAEHAPVYTDAGKAALSRQLSSAVSRGDTPGSDNAELMLHDMNYKFSSDARQAFVRYIALRKTQPLFSNARSIRNALDRMRLRQANRLVADLDRVLTAEDIMSLEAQDVLASRVFSKS